MKTHIQKAAKECGRRNPAGKPWENMNDEQRKEHPPLPALPSSSPSDARALELALLRSRSKPLARRGARDWAAIRDPPAAIGREIGPAAQQAYNPRTMPHASREGRVSPSRRRSSSVRGAASAVGFFRARRQRERLAAAA